MGFIDLNIPYPETSSADKAGTVTKLAVKAMELGYIGIAYNRTIKGVMSDQHRCSIPLLSLSSLLKVAPSLSLSAKLHRDMLDTPAAAPFRQYTRLTVCVHSSMQAQALNSGNPILKTYNLVAVRPLNQTAFDQACGTMEVDIISIDFSEKLPFRLKQPMVKAATERGVYFEVTYSGLVMEVQTRRQMISNVKLLVDWTRGRNIILSSGAPSVNELRGPCDVANLSLLMGLSEERAKAALSKNCRTLVGNALRKKQFYKEAIKVEAISSDAMAHSKEGWYAELLKWDPISSGEGDLLLDDMAKSFSASSQALKAAKAIDFTSVIDSMPSHGFHVKDFMSASNVSPLKPNNDESFLSLAKVNQSTFVVNNLTEQPNRVDLHPEPDKSSLSDASTTTLQAASCANFTDKSIPSGTIEASNLNEEIKTPTKLEFKHVNGSDVNSTLLEATPHDLLPEECISRSAMEALKPNENEKLRISSSDAIVDDAHNNHGKVDIFNPSMGVNFPAFILHKHNKKKSSDIKLNSQIAKTCEPLPEEDIEIAEPMVLETNSSISQNLMNNERLSKQDVDAIEPDMMKKKDYSSVATNLSPDVSMEDQKHDEASADFDQLALIQSASGMPRAKRRIPNGALLFPFKRLLNPVPFKKKAKRNKRHN